MEQVMGESDIVALEIMHRAAHAGETFAEAEVVGGIIFRRFALRPIPVSTILNVDNVKIMIVNDGPAILQAQIVYATDALFENLRGHDRRTNR